MSENQTIEIVMNDDGTVELHGTGFVGKQCEVMKMIARQLGKIQAEKVLDTYYQHQEEPRRQNLGGW